MRTIDLKKDLKTLYSPSAKEAEVVKVPKFNFLMIDGKGDPNNSKEFDHAVQALYSISYTLKFKFKFEEKINYPVMPLEGLWWVGNNEQFDMQQKDKWFWTLMIMQPGIITKKYVPRVIRELKEKKELPSIDSVRLEAFAEGNSVQVLHVGPYGEEPATLNRMFEFENERGLEIRGKHHEIYLSDPRRTKPEKLRTILRHPVRIKKTSG